MLRPGPAVELDGPGDDLGALDIHRTVCGDYGRIHRTALEQGLDVGVCACARRRRYMKRRFPCGLQSVVTVCTRRGSVLKAMIARARMS